MSIQISANLTQITLIFTCEIEKVVQRANSKFEFFVFLTF